MFWLDPKFRTIHKLAGLAINVGYYNGETMGVLETSLRNHQQSVVVVDQAFWDPRNRLNPSSGFPEFFYLSCWNLDRMGQKWSHDGGKVSTIRV